MAFKDKLKATIEAKGGNTQENLSHIADLARAVQPDFTLAYLTRLLLGYPARPEDYQALGAALGISPADLVERNESKEAENRRKAGQFVSERMKRPDLAEQFEQYVEGSARFRTQNVTSDELYVLVHEFFESICDDDEELT